jgi:hypothetical protein
MAGLRGVMAGLRGVRNVPEGRVLGGGVDGGGVGALVRCDVTVVMLLAVADGLLMQQRGSHQCCGSWRSPPHMTSCMLLLVRWCISHHCGCAAGGPDQPPTSVLQHVSSSTVCSCGTLSCWPGSFLWAFLRSLTTAVWASRHQCRNRMRLQERGWASASASISSSMWVSGWGVGG